MGRPHEAEKGVRTPLTGTSGQNKQQGPPAPGLEHLRTSGSKTPRTGGYRMEQGAQAAASRTGTSVDKRRPIPTNGNVGHGEQAKQP